jgi:NifU-like protein involved in Fe-S cluster formation
MQYSPAVLERVRHPKYVGWLPRDARDVGTGEAGSIERGTMTRIQVRIDAETRRVAEAVFKVFGCSAAIASASLVAERLHGVTIDTAKAMEGLTVVAELQLPLERANVAALAVEAAISAVKHWEAKQIANPIEIAIDRSAGL